MYTKLRRAEIDTGVSQYANKKECLKKLGLLKHKVFFKTKTAALGNFTFTSTALQKCHWESLTCSDLLTGLHEMYPLNRQSGNMYQHTSYGNLNKKLIT